jgi:hypothetical protein
MMGKQKQPSFGGKQLSRKAMKNLTGGLSAIGAGLWVCTKDNFSCYFTKGECYYACSIPLSCKFYGGCP